MPVDSKVHVDDERALPRVPNPRFLPRIFTCPIIAAATSRTSSDSEFPETFKPDTRRQSHQPLNRNHTQPAKMSEENIYDEIEIEVSFATSPRHSTALFC